MSANAEQLIRYFVTSPWIVILLSLVCLLAGLLIRNGVRRRRARVRAERHRRYWRDKFESELPYILNRNRNIQALPAPAPIPLLDYDAVGNNASYVLSGEVIGAQAFAGEDQFEYNRDFDLNTPIPVPESPEPDSRVDELAPDWMVAR